MVVRVRTRKGGCDYKCIAHGNFFEVIQILYDLECDDGYLKLYMW